jgi:hypothetical protein
MKQTTIVKLNKIICFFIGHDLIDLTNYHTSVYLNLEFKLDYIDGSKETVRLKHFFCFRCKSICTQTQTRQLTEVAPKTFEDFDISFNIDGMLRRVTVKERQDISEKEVVIACEDSKEVLWDLNEFNSNKELLDQVQNLLLKTENYRIVYLHRKNRDCLGDYKTLQTANLPY